MDKDIGCPIGCIPFPGYDDYMLIQSAIDTLDMGEMDAFTLQEPMAPGWSLNIYVNLQVM